MKVEYVVYSTDAKEKLLCSGSVEAVARYLGVTPASVRSYATPKRRSTKKYRVERIEFEDEAEEASHFFEGSVFPCGLACKVEDVDHCTKYNHCPHYKDWLREQLDAARKTFSVKA